MSDKESILGFALLGLLLQRPMSGYDLRKVFASTAMGSFSDSPGAIYPALGRLEKRGLVRGTIEESQSLRKRRVFKVTSRGTAALKAWLRQTVTRDDVMRRIGELMLRFAFMDEALGVAQGLVFLEEYAARLREYIPSLKEFHREQSRKMPVSARLAFESGIGEYEARLSWATTSLAAYEARTDLGSEKRGKR
jgi:DNA-binding PadR family transcriptional regulator